MTAPPWAEDSFGYPSTSINERTRKGSLIRLSFLFFPCHLVIIKNIFQEDGYFYHQPCTTTASTSKDPAATQAFAVVLNWTEEGLRDSIRDSFVTGDWDPEDDADEVLKGMTSAFCIFIV